MKDGAIQQVDTPLNLYLKPVNRFVASFIGSPAMNFFEGSIQKTSTGFAFSEPHGLQMQLSQHFQASLSSLEGRQVTMGIRPEGIGHVRATLNPAAPTIRGRVRVVEPLGSESFVHLDVGTSSAIAKMDDACPVGMGGTLELPVLEDKIYFFDHQTQTTIPC